MISKNPAAVVGIAKLPALADVNVRVVLITKGTIAPLVISTWTQFRVLLVIAFPLTVVVDPPVPVKVALPALSKTILEFEATASVSEDAVRVSVAGELVPADKTTCDEPKVNVVRDVPDPEDITADDAPMEKNADDDPDWLFDSVRAVLFKVTLGFPADPPVLSAICDPLTVRV